MKHKALWWLNKKSHAKSVAVSTLLFCFILFKSWSFLVFLSYIFKMLLKAAMQVNLLCLTVTGWRDDALKM